MKPCILLFYNEYRGILMIGSSIMGAAVRVPRIVAKNLIRCDRYKASSFNNIPVASFSVKLSLFTALLSLLYSVASCRALAIIRNFHGRPTLPVRFQGYKPALIFYPFAWWQGTHCSGPVSPSDYATWFADWRLALLEVEQPLQMHMTQNSLSKHWLSASVEVLLVSLVWLWDSYRYVIHLTSVRVNSGMFFSREKQTISPLPWYQIK